MNDNDTKITLTKQVEEKKVYTMNEITRDIIDLGIRKKQLQADIVEIDNQIAELGKIKGEVATELNKVKEK